MKAKLLVATVAALLVPAAIAGAFTWHLSYYRAKAATKQVVREVCERDNRCVAYGARCERITESRIDCLGGTVDEGEVGEIECQTMFHWGVNRHGYAKLRIGKTHCAELE